jgi:hypothetical protein
MAKTAQFRSIFFASATKNAPLLNSGTSVLSAVSGFATIIGAIGGSERKLAGVLFNELNRAAVNRQRDKQYA